MFRFPTRRRSGFTLIELLVVIAIIAILASMLFPAFSRARESARKIVCINNLHQIFLGAFQYTQDWDEKYPTGAPAYYTYGVSPVVSPSSDRVMTQVLNPYIKSTQIWNCNSWQGRYAGQASLNVGNYNYITGSNCIMGVENASATPVYPALSLNSVQEPARFMMFFCGSAPGQTSTALINAHTGLNDLSWETSGIGGTSILYADGHTKFLPLDRGRWNRLYTRLPDALGD